MKIRLFLMLICCFTASVVACQVRTVTLTQLEARLAAGKDTTFVVNFWATWCSPCVAELPHFDKLQKETGGKLKVLLVSLDFKSKLIADVIPFAKKMKLFSEVVLLNESNQQAYIDRISPSWSGAIPATLFVNKQKNIRKFYEQEFTFKDLVATLDKL